MLFKDLCVGFISYAIKCHENVFFQLKKKIVLIFIDKRLRLTPKGDQIVEDS